MGKPITELEEWERDNWYIKNTVGYTQGKHYRPSGYSFHTITKIVCKECEKELWRLPIKLKEEIKEEWFKCVMQRLNEWKNMKIGGKGNEIG